MPVFSYLAYPVRGAKHELLKELNNLSYCEAMPADNEEILILVTDTPDPETEEQLAATLKKLHSLESLSMTFGHADY